MVQHAPRFDDDRCIRCFCCHEICPSAAIDLRAGLLARFLDGKSS
jgi:formate hydrogenlyase subunit 6/NADH:ubiquinone oxidoreductase subunit I